MWFLGPLAALWSFGLFCKGPFFFSTQPELDLSAPTPPTNTYLKLRLQSVRPRGLNWCLLNPA
jgi:hypothetical protein